MATLTIEEIETRDQWERAVALRNQYQDDGPTTVERAMNYAAAIPARVKVKRFLITQAGMDLTYVSLLQAYWTPKSQLYDFAISHGADSSGVPLAIEHAEATILDFGGNEASNWYRSDRPAVEKALKQKGYVEGQRNPVGMIRVAEFDPTPWADRCNAVVNAGYQIVTVADYAGKHPETWKHDLWRLEMDIFQDVPLPEPWVEIPFEDWLRDLEANEIRFEWMFLAVMDGEPVAVTQLFPNIVDPRIMNTGLTGVRRAHRRAGLATTLKSHALTLARASGAERVYMDNEINNPMFQLNLSLGVKANYEYVNCSRKLV